MSAYAPRVKYAGKRAPLSRKYLMSSAMGSQSRAQVYVAVAGAIKNKTIPRIPMDGAAAPAAPPRASLTNVTTAASKIEPFTAIRLNVRRRGAANTGSGFAAGSNTNNRANNVSNDWYTAVKGT